MDWTAVYTQEFLATSMLILIFIGVAIAAAYIWTLTRFFNELRMREPEVWENIGAPSLPNMVFLPYRKFYKYYSFFKILRARSQSDYKYAGKAYFMLRFGLVYCLLLVMNVIALVFSIFG